MDPEIGHHPLGDPGSQVTVAHGAEPLQQDQTEEQQDHLCHAVGIVLHGNDIPEVPPSRSNAKFTAATAMTMMAAAIIRGRGAWKGKNRLNENIGVTTMNSGGQARSPVPWMR